MPSQLLQLPSECILNVMTRLPVWDVVCMACSCTALRQQAKDDAFWAGLAEAKWGPAVRQLKPLSEQQSGAADAPDAVPASDQAGELGSWQQYCYKRMCARTISPSPLQLLQESYPDPYQHIICCVLCSRTSGSQLIQSAIAAFFDALPTPTAVLAANDGLLQDLLHPLGLQASRMAAVKSVSHGFLATDWQTPAEFHGCGKFVEDSWRIFCRGHQDGRSVSDANLRLYLSWRHRQQASSAGDADNSVQRKQRKKADKPQKRSQQQQQQESTRRTSPRHQQQGGDGAAGPWTRAGAAATAPGSGAAARLKRSCSSRAAGGDAGDRQQPAKQCQQRRKRARQATAGCMTL